MATHNELGKEGENAAVFYLQDNGYCVHERNWRAGKAEIDIIAERDGVMVFVEIKTRANDSFGDPYEAVNRRKWQLIQRAAGSYICYKQFDGTVRFDILSIVHTNGHFHVEHLENAFTPSLRTIQ